MTNYQQTIKVRFPLAPNGPGLLMTAGAWPTPMQLTRLHPIQIEAMRLTVLRAGKLRVLDVAFQLRGSAPAFLHLPREVLRRPGLIKSECDEVVGISFATRELGPILGLNAEGEQSWESRYSKGGFISAMRGGVGIGPHAGEYDVHRFPTCAAALRNRRLYTRNGDKFRPTASKKISGSSEMWQRVTDDLKAMGFLT